MPFHFHSVLPFHLMTMPQSYSTLPSNVCAALCTDTSEFGHRNACDRDTQRWKRFTNVRLGHYYKNIFVLLLCCVCLCSRNIQQCIEPVGTFSLFFMVFKRRDACACIQAQTRVMRCEACECVCVCVCTCVRRCCFGSFFTSARFHADAAHCLLSPNSKRKSNVLYEPHQTAYSVC